MDQTTYRIYTEDVRETRRDITAIVAEQFDGFTVIRATGYWEGTPERSLIIEIIAGRGRSVRAKVLDVAERIRSHNAQQAVLVTALESETTMVEQLEEVV